MSTYGPFVDEELFYYHDRTTLALDELKIYREGVGLIGFNDLEVIHNQGRKGSFGKVFFSGIMTLSTVDIFCERGLQVLLQKVHKQDPLLGRDSLEALCKKGKIMIELHCQLKGMPICYMAKKRPKDIIIISNNHNNINSQRRYTVKSFHYACLHRSILVLQRYYLLKFIFDVVNRFRNEVLHEERDVHWLVSVYKECYEAVFPGHTRPTLHRSEIYDHLATHAKWLNMVFTRKRHDLLDKKKWLKWVDEVEVLKKRVQEKGGKWGTPMDWGQILNIVDNDDNMDSDTDHSDMPQALSFPSYSDANDSSTSSDSSDSDAEYYIDSGVREHIKPDEHRGLLDGNMPHPTWFWACNITKECTFTIDLQRGLSHDQSCMSTLSPSEIAFLKKANWTLNNKKFWKIWKKMCQAHMDEHWMKIGITVNHKTRRIYPAYHDRVV